MLQITPFLFLDESELQFEFIRASGPGGQNVNKVSSAVQLRFDLTNSSTLSPDVKERLVRLAGNRISGEGVLVIEAKRYRSQERNKADAIQRLVKIIQQATEPPKPRRATRPSVTSQAERLEGKKRRGALKRQRQAKEWE